MIDEKTIQKMFDSVYGDSIDKDSWTYEMTRDGFKNGINLLLPIIQKQDEAIRFYAYEYNYDLGDYHGISGEMRYRCVLNRDMEERNDVYKYAGKLARSTKQEVSEMINKLKGELK